MMWDHGYGWAWFGFFWMVLSWGVLVALVVWAVRRLSNRSGERALEILQERYARGEIDQDEFVARRRELERT